MRHRNRFGALASIAAMSLAAAACGSDDGPTSSDAPPVEEWDEVVSAAEEEGSVVLYTPQTDVGIESLEEAFEEEYPEIDLEAVRLLGGEMATRVSQEQETGAEGADVVVGADPAFMGALEESDGLISLGGPHLEERAPVFEDYPLLRRSENTVIFSAEGYWIVWNTDLVDEPISEYSDIVERADEFEGSVAIPDLFSPSVPIFYTHVQEGVDEVDLTEQFADEGEVTGSEFLEQLDALSPRFYDSAVPLTQAVASGEVKAGIFSVAPTLTSLQSEGAPIEGTLSEEAPTAASLTAGVTSWAANPNAGRVLVDFLLSDEGQAAVNAFDNLALTDDVEGSAGGPELMALPRDEVLDPDYREAYTAYWSELFDR